MTGLFWKQNSYGWLIRKAAELLWWGIRFIPNDQILWRCVYNNHQIKPDGTLKSGFFMNKRVSIDITILTTEDKSCKARGKVAFWIKVPGLVELYVGSVRSLLGDNNIDVEHDPIKQKPKNYAHSIFTKQLSRGQARELVTMCRFHKERQPIF